VTELEVLLLIYQRLGEMEGMISEQMADVRYLSEWLMGFERWFLGLCIASALIVFSVTYQAFRRRAR
jgi:hypothetical protein